MASTTEVRLLANAVRFLVTVPDGPTVMATIDHTGHVEVDPPVRWNEDEGAFRQLVRDRRDEMQEALEETGLAEWRRVDETDSELYATDRLLRMLQPAFGYLPKGWQVIDA